MNTRPDAESLKIKLAEIAKRYRRKSSGGREYDPDIAAGLVHWADQQPRSSIRARAVKAMLSR